MLFYCQSLCNVKVIMEHSWRMKILTCVVYAEVVCHEPVKTLIKSHICMCKFCRWEAGTVGGLVEL